jgi:hypothetical protein
VVSGLESQWKPSAASGRSAFSPRIRLDTSTASLASEAASTAWDTIVVVFSSDVPLLQPLVSAPATSAMAPNH